MIPHRSSPRKRGPITTVGALSLMSCLWIPALATLGRDDVRASRGARLPLAHAVAQEPRLGIDLVDLERQGERTRLEHGVERLVRLIVDRLHRVLLLLQAAAFACADVNVDELGVGRSVADP